MRHVSLRALPGVCLLMGWICCGSAYGGQGLTAATPAKEFIYLGNQMIAIEMAPGSAAAMSPAGGSSAKAVPTSTERKPSSPNELAQKGRGMERAAPRTGEFLPELAARSCALCAPNELLSLPSASRSLLQEGYLALLKQAITSTVQK